jgi:hypothetical protein
MEPYRFPSKVVLSQHLCSPHTVRLAGFSKFELRKGRLIREQEPDDQKWKAEGNYTGQRPHHGRGKKPRGTIIPDFWWERNDAAIKLRSDSGRCRQDPYLTYYLAHNE